MRSKGIFHHHRREGCGDKHGVFGRGRGMRGGPGRGLDRGEGMGRGHGRRGGGRLFDHGSLRWLLLSLIAEKPDHEPSHGYELNIHWVPLVYLSVALGLQLTLQVSALFPGLKAAKLRIVEALRHV